MRLTTLTLLGVVCIATAGCGDDTDVAELPNPAAVFCEEQGGTVSGAEPMCTLPDGTTVDAWELYRAEGPTPDDA